MAAAGPVHPMARRGAREVFALVLLVTGFPPIFGWLAGVGLLLWSSLWSTRQKLLGKLVWQGGYVLVLGILGLAGPPRSSFCTSTPVRVRSGRRFGNRSELRQLRRAHPVVDHRDHHHCRRATRGRRLPLSRRRSPVGIDLDRWVISASSLLDRPSPEGARALLFVVDMPS